MIMYEDSEHIPNNCTKCAYFMSYYHQYDFDDEEPADQGTCQKGVNEGYGDATITCALFEKYQ